MALVWSLSLHMGTRCLLLTADLANCHTKGRSRQDNVILSVCSESCVWWGVQYPWSPSWRWVHAAHYLLSLLIVPPLLSGWTPTHPFVCFNHPLHSTCYEAQMQISLNIWFCARDSNPIFREKQSNQGQSHQDLWRPHQVQMRKLRPSWRCVFHVCSTPVLQTILLLTEINMKARQVLAEAVIHAQPSNHARDLAVSFNYGVLICITLTLTISEYAYRDCQRFRTCTDISWRSSRLPKFPPSSSSF